MIEFREREREERRERKIDIFICNALWESPNAKEKQNKKYIKKDKSKNKNKTNKQKVRERKKEKIVYRLSNLLITLKYETFKNRFKCF